ncbi:hypothetical protein [Mycolicibacterium sp.]
MKKSAFVVLGATALASTAFAFGGTAAAAPTQQSVDQTVKSLETSG